jgi:signal transduction histidine kinase
MAHHFGNGKTVGTRWRWPLLAGVSAPILSYLVALVVSGLFSLVAHSIPSLYKQDQHVTLWLCELAPDIHGCKPWVGLFTSKEILGLSTAVADWSGPLVNLLLTFGAAAWATRRGNQPTVRHGAVAGLTSAFAGLLIISLSRESFLDALGLGLSNLGGLLGRVPLSTLLETVFSASGATLDLWTLGAAFLSVAAGGLGGLEGRAALVDRQKLYQASRAISAAASPEAIVAAIGRHLTGPDVTQVTLWKVAPRAQDDLVLLASWAPHGKRIQPPGLRLDESQVPSLNTLRQGDPVLLQTREMKPPDRAIWEQLGARSLLLLPLTTSEGVLIGLLAVASQAAGGFKRGIWRTELISAQVALALENLRLVEGAQRAAVLEERQRLAREIHDTLAQDSASIVMHLEAAEGALQAGPHGDTDSLAAVQEHLDQARHTAREGLAQARRLVWALRPDLLEGASLPTALERVVTRWSRDNGVAANATTTGTAYCLPAEVEVTLLRAAQEALTNIRKHAQASQVAVTLSYMGDVVVLDVQDDGLGFSLAQPVAPPAAQVEGGFGLTAMRERVEQLGGTLLIESAPGEGTTLVIEIPTPAGTDSTEVQQDLRGPGAQKPGDPGTGAFQERTR